MTSMCCMFNLVPSSNMCSIKLQSNALNMAHYLKKKGLFEVRVRILCLRTTTNGWKGNFPGSSQVSDIFPG